jgi:hypothetical protein
MINNNFNTGIHDNESMHSFGSLKDQKFDTLPFRRDFAKELLKDSKLNSIINFDAQDTEYFINPGGYDESSYSDTIPVSKNSHKNTVKIINKRKLDFRTIIKKIGGSLDYVKSGSTGHTFKGVIKSENGEIFNYAVKVVAYPRKGRYGHYNNISRPENAELMMIRLLSMFVIRKETPHITLPIGTFNTQIDHFTNLIETGAIKKDNKHYNEFLKRYKNKEYYNNVSILISEWANRGDFLEFIRRFYKQFTLMHWKVFFFQILSVLAVIQNKFPTFRHNDLKANNILVHRSARRGKWCRYPINNDTYYVPNIDYKIKLWDFDFACVPGIVNNSKVSAEWTNKINVSPVQNRYYDMHYFFNTFIRKGFFPQFLTEKCIPIEVKKFVNDIIPKKYRSGDEIDKRGRILINDEYTTPNKTIQTHPFFREFRNKKQKSTKIKHNKKKSTIIRPTNSFKVVDIG